MAFLSSTRVFLALVTAFAFTSILNVDATQVMRRPTGYGLSVNKFTIEPHPTMHVISKRDATAKVQAAYFTNWREHLLSICEITA